MPRIEGSAGTVALTWPSSPCTWNSYVEAGSTSEERAQRLAEVPVEWRESVKRHVACEFKIRARMAKKRL